MFHERGCERASDAPFAPGGANVKPPQAQRAYGCVRFDGKAADRDERVRVGSGQQDLARLLEALGIALPIPLQARDVQDAFGIGVRAQSGEARWKGISHANEAKPLAQIFTR